MLIIKLIYFGAVAQLGEHLPCRDYEFYIRSLGKQGVEGSSPSSSIPPVLGQRRGGLNLNPMFVIDITNYTV